MVTVTGLYPDGSNFGANVVVPVAVPTVSATGTYIYTFTVQSDPYQSDPFYGQPGLYAESPLTGPTDNPNGIYHAYKVSTASNVRGWLSIVQTIRRCTVLATSSGVDIYDSETPAPLHIDGSVPYGFSGLAPAPKGPYGGTPEPYISASQVLQLGQVDTPGTSFEGEIQAASANGYATPAAQTVAMSETFDGTDTLMFYPSDMISGGPPNIWVPLETDMYETTGYAVLSNNTWISGTPAPVTAMTYQPVPVNGFPQGPIQGASRKFGSQCN